MNKKLNKDKVDLKLLVVLKEAVVVKANVEATVWEDVVDKEAVHKLFVKILLVQAVLLEGLSQASRAKLKLAQGQSWEGSSAPSSLPVRFDTC